MICLSNFTGLGEGRHYRLSHEPRMVGFTNRQVLNLEMSQLSAYAQKAIDSGWPAIYVGIWTDFRDGVIDAVSGTGKGLTREAMLATHSTTPIHSQLLCGYSRVPSSSRDIFKWKAENSWGAGTGRKGYYSMTQKWFERYVFEIILPSNILSTEHSELLSTTPEHK